MMTLHAHSWYRVKESNQYCQVAGIMSKTDPQVQVRTAGGNMNAFAVALVWFTPSKGAPGAWTKRAILLDPQKASGLLREPREDDLPVIRNLKAIAKDVPFHSMCVDGVKTEPIGDP